MPRFSFALSSAYATSYCPGPGYFSVVGERYLGLPRNWGDLWLPSFPKDRPSTCTIGLTGLFGLDGALPHRPLGLDGDIALIERTTRFIPPPPSTVPPGLIVEGDGLTARRFRESVSRDTGDDEGFMLSSDRTDEALRFLTEGDDDLDDGDDNDMEANADEDDDDDNDDDGNLAAERKVD